MNDRLSLNTTLRVAKRDGSLEPFSPSKLLACIQNGLASCGEYAEVDATTSRGLVEAVYEYLLTSADSRPVPARQLIELVEWVLSQTGHTAAGMAIRQHAWCRDQNRKKLLVATQRKHDGRFLQRRWNKAHLIGHLRRRHLLDTPASRMVAGRVEQLIFNCGLKVVTSGLVQEMARSELLAWGLLPGALAVKKTPLNRRPVRDYDSNRG